MKKTIALALLAAFVFSVVGCKGDQGSQMGDAAPGAPVTKDTKTKGGPGGATLD